MNKYEDKNGNIVNEDYDFTIETASKIKRGRQSEELKSLQTPNTENKDIFKKYIIYRKYGKIMDPDSNSELLQKIYNDHWEKEYLKKCIDNERNIENLITVHSDTMTSAQTLLNKFYETVCDQEWKKYKKNHKKVKFCSQGAMMNILTEIKGGSKDYPMFEEYFLDDTSNVAQFLRYYHTIGNYIPVPQKFNNSRSGSYGSHDRWNLTLSKIEKYYQIDNRDPIIKDDSKILMELLFSYNGFFHAKEWLDSFGSWKVFISENYLQDYVDTKEKSWPIKEEFKKFNDWDNPLPDHLLYEDYDKYFKLVVETIKARGNNILLGKKEKVEDETK